MRQSIPPRDTPEYDQKVNEIFDRLESARHTGKNSQYKCFSAKVKFTSLGIAVAASGVLATVACADVMGLSQGHVNLAGIRKSGL